MAQVLKLIVFLNLHMESKEDLHTPYNVSAKPSPCTLPSHNEPLASNNRACFIYSTQISNSPPFVQANNSIYEYI